MKKIIAASVVLAAMSSGAMAQATQDVNLSATVPAFCSIDGGSTTTARSADATSQISNGRVTGAVLTITGAAGVGVCNVASLITLTSEKAGLRSSTTATGDFVNRIDYIASATFGSQTNTLDSSSAAAGTPTAPTSVTGANAGDVTIAITTTSTPSGKYLVPGGYADKLTVTSIPTLNISPPTAVFCRRWFFSRVSYRPLQSFPIFQRAQRCPCLFVRSPARSSLPLPSL